MPYDYWADMMQEKQPQQPAVPQPAPAQAPIAEQPTGYDYAADLLSEQPGAQPGGQLETMTGRVPASETVETDELSFLGQMKEMWTGERRRAHDWPEVPAQVDVDGTPVPVQNRMALARDNDVARAQIFMQSVPGAEVDFDENMVPFTMHFGEPMYLNTPGASMADIPEAAMTVATEYPAARIGAGIGRKALGATGQLMGAGTALFGTSAAMDKVAQIFGSDQPVDWKRAQMTGAFGVAGEATGMLLGRFFTRMFGNKKFTDKTGDFTPAGRKVLENQGIDPATVSDAFKQKFIQMTREAVEPQQAVRMAEAESLPQRVRLTKGELMSDVREQQMERAAAKGALGQKSYEEMDRFKLAQRAELEANRDIIQAQMGGVAEPTVTAVGEGMETAQQSMQAARQALHRSMRSAYDEADRLGMRVDVEGLRLVRDHVNEALKTFPRRNNPVRDELLELNKVTQTTTGPRIKNVSIKEMEDLRSRLTRMSQAPDPQTAQAARTAVKALDDGLNTAIEAGAYSGNIDALKAYQRGRSTRAKIGRMFEQDAIVNRIMEPTAGPYSILKRPPDEASNLIFSASGLGFKNGAERALKRIRVNLMRSGDQQAWNAIREEAVWRLFKPTVAAEVMSDGNYAFSGKKFATAMDKAFDKHKRVMNVLFTPQEQRLLRQYRNVALRATEPLKGAENFSNTSIVGSRLLEEIFGPAARIVRNAAQAIDTARNFAEGMTASTVRRSTGYGEGFAQQSRRLPPGAVGGLSALAGAEQLRRQERMSQQDLRRLQQ